ncbi:CcmD family protein [Flavihumibacter petaseus]|uniref:CcmD family protein n=1 Tax=Flavihumibacter petaseus NBRC 106054 TaxID=1220578 RepID=A0A0E9MUW1_9BACT|nr:CcmD family protein [Flavihumibacter petaseus]GAO41221.1 hypothetical protein FPE01S_01_02330 [Flavihumibacter petaseus NBRC 106054]
MLKHTAFLLVMFLLLLLPAGHLLAQNPAADGPVQMADGLRADGKIWVVVAVFFTIVAGLILYLIRLDRKISQLEQK